VSGILTGQINIVVKKLAAMTDVHRNIRLTRYDVCKTFIKFGLTDSLTPWSEILLATLIIVWLIKKFPTCYGIKMFITVFKRTSHWKQS